MLAAVVFALPDSCRQIGLLTDGEHGSFGAEGPANVVRT
jgi:hypothetical protein